MDWAYSDKLAAESTVDDSIYMMIQLYLLGDKLDDKRLRNKALKALHSYVTIDNVQPGATDIKRIWRETPPSSLLRKWVIDVTILRSDRKNFKNGMAEFPSEFVQDLALKFIEQTPLITVKDFQVKLSLYVEAEEDV